VQTQFGRRSTKRKVPICNITQTILDFLMTFWRLLNPVKCLHQPHSKVKANRDNVVVLRLRHALPSIVCTVISMEQHVEKSNAGY